MAVQVEGSAILNRLANGVTDFDGELQYPLKTLEETYPDFKQTLAFVKVDGELSESGQALYQGLVSFVGDFDSGFDSQIREGRMSSDLFQVARANVWKSGESEIAGYTKGRGEVILNPRNRHGTILNEGEPVGYVTEPMSNEIVHKKFQDHLSMLRDISLHAGGSENTVVAAPVAGAANIASGLLQRNFPSEKLFLPDLRGTNGTETGGNRTEVVDFPEELKDRSKTLIIAEDIIDSGNTAFEFVAQRLFAGKTKEQLPDDQHALYDEIDTLRTQNEALNKAYTPYTDERFKPIYKRLAALMADTDTVMTAFVSKNDVFKNILHDEARRRMKGNEGNTKWGYRQMMALHTMIDMPQNRWVVGGNAHVNPGYEQLGMFDMGLKGDKVLPHIKKLDPAFAKRLEEDGFTRMTMRLCARIGPMLWFKYDKEVDGENNGVRFSKSIASQLVTAYEEGRLYP